LKYDIAQILPQKDNIEQNPEFFAPKPLLKTFFNAKFIDN